MGVSKAEALEELDTVTETKRATVIEGAVRELVRMREYDRARSIADKNPSSATAQMLRAVPTLAPVPPSPSTSKDPKIAARLALEASIGAGNAGLWAWDEKTRDEIVADQGLDAPLEVAIVTWGTAAMRDLLLSVFTINSIGEPTGPWRVEFATPVTKAYYFVAFDGGQAKVIGTPQSFLGVGRHVQRLLKAGALDDATQLLDWIAPLLTKQGLGKILGMLGRTKDDLALAGAFLAYDPGIATLLKQCTREVCTLMAAVAEADTPGKRMNAATAKGDLPAAIVEAEAMLQAEPSPIMQNQTAWLLYVQGTDLTRALELANTAIGSDPTKATRNVLNTRAAIYVELGRYAEAIADLAQAHVNSLHRDARADSYVYARIAERLGYAAEAKALYREVAKGPNKSPISEETLAKKRL
jgi:hypothetical protein